MRIIKIGDRVYFDNKNWNAFVIELISSNDEMSMYQRSVREILGEVGLVLSIEGDKVLVEFLDGLQLHLPMRHLEVLS